MTRKYNAAETQTGFGGWLRNNPNLDSVKEGLCILDSDYWIHKFKTIDDKSYHWLMLVEVKEFGADLNGFQRETLHEINQLLRNRKNKKTRWHARQEITCECGRKHVIPRTKQVYSTFQKKMINVLCFGSHCLRFSGDATFAQWSEILWDNKRINVETLEGILRFEIDPDDFSKIDHRPNQRHKRSELESTLITELGFEVQKKIFQCS